MSTARLNSVIRVVTGLVGLALIAYFTLYFTRESTKLSGWHRSGGLWSETSVVDSLVIFTKIDPGDFLTAPFPHPGDTVVAVNDTLVTVALWTSYFDSLRPSGVELPISYLHAGDTIRVTVVPRQPDPNIFALMSVLQILRFLISGLSIGVGLWAFFARPDSAAVRALAFFSFSMGAFTIGGVQALSGRFASFTVPYMDQVQQVLMLLVVFFGAFWLNLQLLFPKPARFMLKHPVLAYSLCYVPVILLLAATFVIDALVGKETRQVLVAIALVAVVLLQVVAGLIILAFRYKSAQDRVERRQTRLVLFGSGIGLSLLLALIILAAIYRNGMPGGLIGALIIINVTFTALLLSPLTFAYAFGRYRLLEVEGKLRRGTRYVITAGLLIALFVAIGVAAVRRTVETGDPLTILAVIGLAIAVVPLSGAVRKILERKFYPERRRLREMIHDFLQHALSIPDKHTFWSELETRLQAGLRVERVHPVLLSAGNSHYVCMIAGVTPFTTESAFVHRLANERRPLLVDEVIASARISLTDEEALWLESQRVGLIVPLVSHSSLVGFLGLGQKTEKEDYAPEELRILDSLSPQIALASENIRLIEENVIKKQLEEQLQMARRIQQGFLPQEIPATEGLEIAAGSRFCLDVAGDYYDVIPLPDGRTVLAVGDVSGKGAGAALLMANLQASLRTAVGMGSALDEVVSRINDLIYRNTPPEQYITFFVGVYEARSATLAYVNAGHNPPLLIRRNGDLQILDIGGLILGFMPEIDYELGTVKLEPEDLIVMYTDGVSEAMNIGEEEFGEKRIINGVHARRRQPVFQILSTLESEVVDFRGSSSFDDDFTLLLARRV